MKTRHRSIIAVGLLLTVGYTVAVDGSESVLGRVVALSSVFSGLLTLTGFMFTARTFITFKLNEVVYGKPEYQQRVEAYQADGAYTLKLYEPLRELDSKVGRTCLLCFATLFFVLAFSFLPKEWSKLGTSICDSLGAWCSSTTPLNESLPWRFVVYQVATIVVYCVIFMIIVEVFSTIMSVNQNIRSIIGEWEAKYSSDKEERRKKDEAAQTAPKP